MADSKRILVIPTSDLMEEVTKLIKNPWIEFETMLTLIVDYWRVPNPKFLDDAIRDYLLGGIKSKDLNSIQYLSSDVDDGYAFLKERKASLLRGVIIAYEILKPRFDRFLERRYMHWDYGPIWVRLFAGDMVICLTDIKRIAPVNPE